LVEERADVGGCPYVRRAVQEMRIEYPVAIDDDYGAWTAFGTTTGRRLDGTGSPPGWFSVAGCSSRVLIDGQPPDAANGADVDGNGHGTATGQRLYQLIRQAGPVTDRTLEISFPGPGIQVYAFTFG